MILPQEVWEQKVSQLEKKETPEQKKRAEELTKKMRNLSPEERRKRMKKTLEENLFL